MRYAIPLVVLAMAGLLIIAACGEGVEEDPTRLAPAGTTLMVELQVARALEDEDLAAFYDEIPKEMFGDEDVPQTLEALLDLVADETGIDVRKLGRVLVFGDLKDLEALEDGTASLGVIATGTFNAAALGQGILEAADGPGSTEEYKGRNTHPASPRGASGLGLRGGPVPGGNWQRDPGPGHPPGCPGRDRREGGGH